MAVGFLERLKNSVYTMSALSVGAVVLKNTLFSAPALLQKIADLSGGLLQKMHVYQDPIDQNDQLARFIAESFGYASMIAGTASITSSAVMRFIDTGLHTDTFEGSAHRKEFRERIRILDETGKQLILAGTVTILSMKHL